MLQSNVLNREAMTIRLDGPLPEIAASAPEIRRAPDRTGTPEGKERQPAPRNERRDVAEKLPRERITDSPGGFKTGERIDICGFRPDRDESDICGFRRAGDLPHDSQSGLTGVVRSL